MRAFMRLIALLPGVAASTVDPRTGISFEKFASVEGYNFGIALPQRPTTDFIGQIIAPTTGSGYGGLTLTGKMANSLLIVAWPNGKDVVASFRYATGHVAPSVFAEAYAPGSTLSMTPIANGTYVNSTHLSYTFICRGCITGDTLSFPANASTTTFGWALSANAVTSPESATSAALKFHNKGYGQFSLDLNSARSANFETWAAAADSTSPSTSPKPSGGSPVTIKTTGSAIPTSTGSSKPAGNESGRTYYPAIAALPLSFLISIFVVYL